MEVFTLPPYSTWNPCGIHVVPHGICPFHMEYILAEISPILVISFHLYSTWIPPFHMEFPHGIQVESSITNIRIIEIIVQINTEQ
jgi:hypothetical protein